MYRLKLCMILH